MFYSSILFYPNASLENSPQLFSTFNENKKKFSTLFSTLKMFYRMAEHHSSIYQHPEQYPSSPKLTDSIRKLIPTFSTPFCSIAKKLPSFRTMLPLYTPWKRKIKGFPLFTGCGVIEKEPWPEMS